jgi:O-antigen ligase/tetratricopeptide (TPR) repeat protein
LAKEPEAAWVPRSSAAGAAARAVLLLHLVLSPLVFANCTTEGFEFNKVALLVLTAIVLSALAASQTLGRIAGVPPGERWRTGLLGLVRHYGRQPIALGIVLFLISAAVSTVTSISPRTSFFGAHESFGGLITVTAYCVLFFATRRYCRTQVEARRLLTATVLGGAVASTYALVQVAKADPIAWGGLSNIQGYVRPFGTLGHPNFLAAYLVMVFPIALALVQRTAHQRRWFACAVFGLVAVMSLGAIALSVSRGAWLALAAVVIVLLIGWLRLGERRKVLAVVVLLLAATGVGLVALGMSSGQQPLVSIVQRGQQFGEAASRRQVWQAAVGIFGQSPVWGCGLDAFQLAYERQRTVAYWMIEWNSTPAKAHNELLHILATQGLCGAAAVAVLMFGLARGGVQTWRRATVSDRPLLLAVIAGVVGFIVQDFFSFTVVGCGTLFVTLAAILSRHEEAESSIAAELPKESFRPFALSLVAAALLGAVIFFANVFDGTALAGRGTVLGEIAILLAFGLVTLSVLRAEWGAAETPASRSAPVGREKNAPGLAPTVRLAQVGVWAGAAVIALVAVVRPWQADHRCWQSDRFLGQDPGMALQCLEEAVALDSTKELFWTRLGCAAQAGGLATPDAAEQEQLLGRAREAFERSVALVPANSYNHANLGRLLGELARRGRAEPAQAFAELETALTLDATNVYFYADAAKVALGLGEWARARGYALRGVELYPRFAPIRALLGCVALLEQQNQEAAGLLDEALRSDWHGDDSSYTIATANLAAALVRLRRYDEALTWARVTLERDPESINGHLHLGNALEMLGRKQEAIGEYRYILARCPDHQSARAALRLLLGERFSSGDLIEPPLPGSGSGLNPS